MGQHRCGDGRVVRDRSSLFNEGPAGVWRGLGARDRTSLFDAELVGLWRGLVVFYHS